MLWEAALYDKLEPLTHYTEAQIQAFTPDQLAALIGPDGTWITAGVLFIACLILVPVLFTYKACFFPGPGADGIPDPADNRGIRQQRPLVQILTRCGRPGPFFPFLFGRDPPVPTT